MGYTTEFEGGFTLNRPLDAGTRDFLTRLSETRRMARRLPSMYGIEGEFYVDGTDSFGQDKEESIIDYNRPPRTQPSLWCQWRPNDDGTAIIWDGVEKFYDYVEWLNYIIKNVLAPKNYILNGDMKYQGEDSSDFGIIRVRDNVVTRLEGKKVIEEEEKSKVIHLKAKGDPSPQVELLRAKAKAAQDLLNEVLVFGYHENLHKAAGLLQDWQEEQDEEG